MALWIMFGILAAFGALAVLWALFGFLLPGQKGTVTVHLCSGCEEAAVRRYRWMRGLGLLRGRLILVDSGLSDAERERLRCHGQDVEFCTLAELTAGLEQERKELE